MPWNQICHFEWRKLVGTSAMNLRQGFGHAINRSVRDMLLFLPEPVKKHQVVEIQMSSKTE